MSNNIQPEGGNDDIIRRPKSDELQPNPAPDFTLPVPLPVRNISTGLGVLWCYNLAIGLLSLVLLIPSGFVFLFVASMTAPVVTRPAGQRYQISAEEAEHMPLAASLYLALALNVLLSFAIIIAIWMRPRRRWPYALMHGLAVAVALVLVAEAILLPYQPVPGAIGLALPVFLTGVLYCVLPVLYWMGVR
jgi:hypothetical protein